MTSLDCREFSSWDEIKPGDKLVWVTRGEVSKQYLVVFESVIDQSMKGDNISKFKEEDYDDEGWSTDIYPRVWGSMTCGWKLVQEQYQYDPSQQGDTEDDI